MAQMAFSMLDKHNEFEALALSLIQRKGAQRHIKIIRGLPQHVVETGSTGILRWPVHYAGETPPPQQVRYEGL